MVEAAIAVLIAFTAMFGAAALGLYLLDASSSTSLVPAAMATVGLALGGSADFSGGSGNGFLTIGLAGDGRVMPLGVTLIGTVALGLAFFLPLRRRRLAEGPLAARIGAAVGTGFLLLEVCAYAGSGSLSLPESVTSRFLPGGPGEGAQGGLDGLLGGLGGSPSGDGAMEVAFRISGAQTLFGGLVWLLTVLTLGLVATRRVRLPVQLATGRLRTAAGPALSAIITVVLGPAVVLLVAGTVGGLVLAGDDGRRVAGAALLGLPNLLFAALSTGAQVPWSLSTGGSVPQDGAADGLLGMIGGGVAGEGGGLTAPEPRTVGLTSLMGGGSPLEIVLPLLIAVVLLACGVLAAARTPIRTRRDGSPLKTRSRRAAVQAVRLGVLWSAVLFTADLVGGFSGSVTVSMMDSPMMVMEASIGADGLPALVMGLLAGAIAGAAGSLGLDTFRSVRVHYAHRRAEGAASVSSSQASGDLPV